jgi:fructose-1,6-bisphosphatase/inositol monophosphatase family enzyme
MIRNHAALLSRIREIHAAIRDAVVAACEQTAIERLAVPLGEEGGDTIFAIDRVSEHVLLEHFATLADEWSCVLVAEGLGATGRVVLPEGSSAEQAELCIIVDPIDGTRGLMYQKRAAWILTGVAPNHGPTTNLSDIELAVQTEIPLIKQHLCDSLWVVAGQGVGGERFNRLTGERQPLTPRPSHEPTIAQGYGGLARFFPGARGLLATIEDELIERTLGPQSVGKALAFEDQYISTGGQLYELLMGHDRWIADLRPLVEPVMQRQGRALGLCCHPYDLCTELIAREAGVRVTDAHGQPLAAPLDVFTDVAWIGYANPAIHDQVTPVLTTILREHGLLVQEGAGGVAD